MLERFGVEVDASLQIPQCPPALQHVMSWFEQLRAWGRQGFNGAHSIVWADADAWARRMRANPTPTEWRLLMGLDARFRQAAQNAKPATPTHPGLPPRRGR